MEALDLAICQGIVIRIKEGSSLTGPHWALKPRFLMLWEAYQDALKTIAEYEEIIQEQDVILYGKDY